MGKSFAELRDHAEKKAWLSLSKYKFMMFGYWAAIWVHYNKECTLKNNNPFSHLVKFAKRTLGR